MSRKNRQVSPGLFDGLSLEVTQFTATDAKNDFSEMFDLVTQGQAIVITKHDSPKAVMISFEEFQALAQRGKRELDFLKAEFDKLLSNMQTPEASAGIKEAFDASPTQLGLAAIAAVKGQN